MKRYLLCLIIALCTTFLHAQITPAWIRRLPSAQWAQISRLTSLSRIHRNMPAIVLQRRAVNGCNVKTTPKNLLHHKIFYSGLFSRQEKEVLLSPTYPMATLGKVAYLYDKHALYFDVLSLQTTVQVNSQAFTQHQKILQEVLTALQRHYQQQIALRFESPIFSQAEINNLIEQGQAPAYVLSPQEIQTFAQLPSLQAQQAWTQRHLDTQMQQISPLFLHPTPEINPAQFEQYYFAQLRLQYFDKLSQVLRHSTQKRPSAIVRFKRPLPGQTEPLTDAQRLGMLQRELDEHPSRPTSPEQQQALKQAQLYAAAEALHAPYEIALRYGPRAPELLGEEEGSRLRQLSAQACLQELQPRITRLQEQMEQLRTQTPADLNFYVQYYQLHTQLEIYKTLVAKARFTLHRSRP